MHFDLLWWGRTFRRVAAPEPLHHQAQGRNGAGNVGHADDAGEGQALAQEVGIDLADKRPVQGGVQPHAFPITVRWQCGLPRRRRR
jgi:hypothetical protein